MEKYTAKHVSCGASIKSAPADALVEYRLKSQVVTCDEAARAKDISLGNELKTLILETSIGLVALHVPGNKRASLRKVKRHLGCKQAYLASGEVLSSLGLIKGAVCPLLDPIWEILHLVDRQVLSMQFASTNSGRLDGYFVFDPNIFSQASRMQKGEFVDDA